MTRVAIVGASGFVGRRLTERLARDGISVVAIGRDPRTLPAGDGITRMVADVAHAEGAEQALAGCEAAYYLVHSLGDTAFAHRDRATAESFADACVAAGVKRIVYLGGLGSGELSEHLRSRQEVGDALRASGLDVVELRAAVILGPGSVSFEMMRTLVERLPVMVCPRWLRTPIQPIAIADVVSYLADALDVAPGVYEIGGERTTYLEMMSRYASIRGLRPRMILMVPLLSLRLSSYWVDLVTPIDHRVSHALIESLAVPVLARRAGATREAFGIDPVSLDEALRAALDEEAGAVAATLHTRPAGERDGVHTIRTREPIERGEAARARRGLASIGGSIGWYGWTAAWWLRMALGRLAGERAALSKPPRLIPGGTVDWWKVESARDDSMVLSATAWGPGDAWLGFRVGDDALVLSAAFRPRGLPGLLYWRLLGPVHRAAFRAMARRRVRAARSWQRVT